MPPKAKSSGAKASNGQFKNRIVGLEMVPAGELAVHPRNWRHHPEEQRSALLGVLETIGIADAVLAYKSEETGKLTLIDGHLRQDLIDQDVPVLVTDLDDDEANAMLATHDVITTMALPDENELRSLLDDVIDRLPNETVAAIDPDFGEDLDLDTDDPGAGKFPIVPQLDEGYDYVVIFCTRESEFGWIRTVLDLPKKKDKTRVGVSRVLTVDEFKERWQARSSQS